MNHFSPPSCREYNELSRRQLLRGAGVFASSALASSWLPQVALAQDHHSNRDVLISIFLRGGADGLTLCVPHGDPGYYAPGVRPSLAIARPDSQVSTRALDLDGFFGFPQAMGSLLPAYRAGHLLVVHATGSVDATRSHFQAQHNMEAGVLDDINLQTGWLGRHLATIPPLQPSAPLRALSLGYAVPVTLAGATKATALPGPGRASLSGLSRYAGANQDWLRNAYAGAPEMLQESALTTLDTLSLLQRINFAAYRPSGGAVYPNTSLGRSLMATAALIKAQVGVEAIHTDYGIWDTHTQAGPTNGYMAGLMRDFADSIAAFHADMFAQNTPNLALVALSEFGRTVRENASQGTDHGHGNVMFVLGDHILGGQVFAKWPGLNRDQLDSGSDLKVTIDHRDILGEVVSRCLGNQQLSVVFPGVLPVFHGITRT
ncbi:MAG: DUF1501 domain-containing protein [Chthonomonadaceae bacterium]|nr:DUF1501 domain-containing protein [Chthonomonadaceae bacterium]